MELQSVIQNIESYLGKPCAFDLEGGCGGITCFSLSSSAALAHVVPLAYVDGTSVWIEQDEVRIFEALKRVMEDPATAKIMQNGLYDSFVLAWTYGIVARNFAHDTMILFWEGFAELKKGLATQVSLLTRHPFYKPDVEDGALKFFSDADFWHYSGLDAMLTYECWGRMMGLLAPEQLKHYQFNMSLIPAVLYMELRGIKFDKAKAKAAGTEAERGAMELQAKIDWEQTRVTCDVHGAYAQLYDAIQIPCELTFAKLVLRCLGGKNPRVKVETVKERWQPMRWSGKKWVKDGKLTKEPPPGRVHRNETTPVIFTEHDQWWKPRHKTTLKLQPFTPASLSDCEPHILESKRGEWKRVKAIWKEIRNAERLCENASESTHDDQAGCSAGTGSNSDDGVEPRVSATSALLGELSTLLGLAVNIGSTNQGGDAQKFLYETCGLRRIYKDQWTGRLSWEAEGEWRKRVARGSTCGSERSSLPASEKTANGEDVDSSSAEPQTKQLAPAGKRLSTDQQALDKLYAATQDVRVLWCLQQRRLRLAAVNLAKEIDDDGRIRSSISLVKETGRMAASESPTGTGTNLQSWDKDHRGVCVTDEGCVMGQCDLEGADSWTVAAECATLGDPKMLEDLRAGLKPAKGLCFGYLEPESYERASALEIRTRLKLLEQPSWLYPGAKAACHGSSYGMGWKTMIDNVLKFSMADLPLDLASAKPVVLTKAQVEKLQGAFLRRYPGVKLWHAKTEKLLLTTGVLEMSTGHRRRIYQRKAEFKQGRKVACHETLKEILSSAPQYYTTYSIKLALAKLWYAPENRDGESLRVEPLLCVHDSILCQWKREDDSFARLLMKEIFQNEIEIAGQKIVIPAEGFVYSDWSMAKEKAEKL